MEIDLVGKRDLGTENALLKRARAFVGQRYPLSSEGVQLRLKTLESITNGSSFGLKDIGSFLPSVENPRLELFQDLTIPEGREADIFGKALANVQVTKGCSHKCDFCAAGSIPIVETMPFAAVLKIGEKKLAYDETCHTVWSDWLRDIRIVTKNRGVDIDELLTEYDEIEKAEGYTHGLTDYLIRTQPSLVGMMKRAYSRHPLQNISEFFISPENIDPIGRLFNRDRMFPNRVQNYYDSDPFDYRDSLFLHEDGASADYGDVVKALASSIRPIHITTAGWSRQNRVAKRGAEKIFAMGAEFVSVPRLSISPFDFRAKRDMGNYLEDMKMVITEFSKLNGVAKILLFDSAFEFRTFVGDPLRTFIDEKKMTNLQVISPKVSYFSGPMSKEESLDHDVMSCMPGYHIWPSGELAHQNYELRRTILGEIEWDVADGTRPQIEGYSLF